MARPLERINKNGNGPLLVDPNARAELGMIHDCPMCGREIAWEYLLCLWCREQQLEDKGVARAAIATGGCGEPGHIALVRRKPLPYGGMRVERPDPRPRKRDA